MNELMSVMRIASFERLLAVYRQARPEGNVFDAIDGGAGWGATSQQILKHLAEGRMVYAFEPFPGNHRFFEEQKEGIQLIPKALAEANKKMRFRVPSIVTEESVWGKRGLVGYSSVGHLVSGRATDKDIEVECVTADEVIPAAVNIGFVKLDLQGGELNALRGMSRILESTKLMWVEFTGQAGLLDFLIEADFMLFDTEYFFMGSPQAPATTAFDVSRQDVVLSTGKMAWFGFRRKSWKNFEIEFGNAREQLGMVQTDLVCINRRYMGEFIDAFRYL